MSLRAEPLGKDVAAIEGLRGTIEALEREISRTIVGQEIVVRGVTIPRVTVVIDRSGTIVAVDQVKDAAGDSKRVAGLIKKLAK